MKKKLESSKRTQMQYVEIAKKTYRVTSRTKDFDQRIFVSSQPLKKEHDLKHQLKHFRLHRVLLMCFVS